MMSLIPLTLALHGAQLHAWFPFVRDGETLYLKWGDNRASSGVEEVTWSIVPNGTAGDVSFCGASCPGVSGDAIALEVAPGMGFAPLALIDMDVMIQAAFDQWSAQTDIAFRRVSDAGSPINGPSADVDAGQIRFAVFAFSSGGAASGFAPPPNGGTGAGDVLLNSNAFFQIAEGNQGDAFDTRFAPNDLPGVLLHEIGHAIGLAHPVFDGECPVMQVDPACAGRINRQLAASDRSSIRFLYGPIFASGFE